MKAERFLADSSVWIKFLRESDHALKEKIASLALEGRLFTCDVITLEILRGARSKKEFTSLREDFLALPQLSITSDVWETAWKTSYSLRRRGVNAPLADILIAAVALEHGCVLMHADKHYRAIAAHTGLKAVE